MVIKREKVDGIIIQNYLTLIDYIISNTEMNIAFIPHVVWSNSDDRIPLSSLFNRYKDTGRVVMIKDNNAELLKGYISCCRYMIAARTHASIAAYSSGVPTIVVGYSVKAEGIAKDLLCGDNSFVVPVQTLTQTDALLDSFISLQRRESSIHSRLDRIIPEYIDSLNRINDHIYDLI